MKASEILKGFQPEMESMGWKRERIQCLEPVYVASSTITPFLFCERAINRYGVWVLDGFVGVLHRRFEADFYRWNGVSKGFCLAKHIQNFLGPELSIRESSVSEDLSRAASEIAGLLTSLPENIAQLRSMLEKGRIGSISLEGFVGAHVDRDKFAEFRDYVLSDMGESPEKPS